MSTSEPQWTVNNYPGIADTFLSSILLTITTQTHRMFELAFRNCIPHDPQLRIETFEIYETNRSRSKCISN